MISAVENEHEEACQSDCIQNKKRVEHRRLKATHHTDAFLVTNPRLGQWFMSKGTIRVYQQSEVHSQFEVNHKI